MQIRAVVRVVPPHDVNILLYSASPPIFLGERRGEKALKRKKKGNTESFLCVVISELCKVGNKSCLKVFFSLFFFFFEIKSATLFCTN